MIVDRTMERGGIQYLPCSTLFFHVLSDFSLISVMIIKNGQLNSFVVVCSQQGLMEHLSLQLITNNHLKMADISPHRRAINHDPPIITMIVPRSSLSVCPHLVIFCGQINLFDFARRFVNFVPPKMSFRKQTSKIGVPTFKVKRASNSTAYPTRAFAKDKYAKRL